MAEPDIASTAVPDHRVNAVPRAAEAAKAPRQKIREMELVISEVIWETADTVTLNLFASGERMDYQAGQFITIRPQQFPATRFCRVPRLQPRDNRSLHRQNFPACL